MDGFGVIPTPAYGIYHRGVTRTLLRVAIIDPASGRSTAWHEVLAQLRASGVTTVRVLIPWIRHSRSPNLYCVDGSDGKAPDAMGVLSAAVRVGLDVWVDASPVAGGVPRWVAEACPGARALDARGRETGTWATGDARFRAAAAAWAKAVAAASMKATEGHVALWSVDGCETQDPTGGNTNWRRPASWAQRIGFPADHSDITVEQFRRWLRDRYGDDRSLAREWLRPGLRIDGANPPSILGQMSWFARLATRGELVGTRLAQWIRRRLAGVELAPLVGPWPEVGARRGVRSSLPVARDGHSPGQLADWHAFTVAAWREYLVAMRDSVDAIVPNATFVAGEIGRSGFPGIGDTSAGTVREERTSPLVPVGRVGLNSHDAAWVASSLTARSGEARPVIVAVDADSGGSATVAVALTAIAEGAVAVELPEAAYGDPEVRRFADWLVQWEELLTASTRLDDRVAWIDEPAHGGVDPDDFAPGVVRGAVNRDASAAVFGAVREAGLSVVLVPSETFATDGEHECVALLAPTRRWIDLERYGSLVVHVLRGGDLVAFPHRPVRQRDGTAFRSTFLWPPSIANGGRVQIRDGTSTLVAPTVGDGELGKPRPDWIGLLLDSVTPRFRIGTGVRLAITGRLLPDGACLAFVVNPTDLPQAGQIDVPDPSSIGLSDGFSVAVEFATTGVRVRQDGGSLLVDLPVGGALVARLFHDA